MGVGEKKSPPGYRAGQIYSSNLQSSTKRGELFVASNTKLARVAVSVNHAPHAARPSIHAMPLRLESRRNALDMATPCRSMAGFERAKQKALGDCPGLCQDNPLGLIAFYGLAGTVSGLRSV